MRLSSAAKRRSLTRGFVDKKASVPTEGPRRFNLLDQRQGQSPKKTLFVCGLQHHSWLEKKKWMHLPNIHPRFYYATVRVNCFTPGLLCDLSIAAKLESGFFFRKHDVMMFAKSNRATPYYFGSTPTTAALGTAETTRSGDT